MAPSFRGIRRRSRTQLAIQRIRLEARLAGLRIEANIDPRADISSRVILHFWGGRGSTIRLKIGPHVRIEDGAVLRFKGGCSVELGEGSVVRSGAVLNVSGCLDLQGHNLISWGTVIHSAERVVIGAYSGISEGITIVDSTHYRSARGGGRLPQRCRLARDCGPPHVARIQSGGAAGCHHRRRSHTGSAQPSGTQHSRRRARGGLTSQSVKGAIRRSIARTTPWIEASRPDDLSWTLLVLVAFGAPSAASASAHLIRP